MRTFGNYRPLPTAEEAYSDGYKTGAAWKDNYYPGGPPVFGAHEWEKEPGWSEWCAATQENRREWLRGFDDGRAAKNLK